MVGKYLDILESFKEHQISKVLREVRQRIILTVNSDFISDKVNVYFEEINSPDKPFSNTDDDEQVISLKRAINSLSASIYSDKKLTKSELVTVVDSDSEELVSIKQCINELAVKHLEGKKTKIKFKQPFASSLSSNLTHRQIQELINQLTHCFYTGEQTGDLDVLTVNELDSDIIVQIKKHINLLSKSLNSEDVTELNLELNEVDDNPELNEIIKELKVLTKNIKANNKGPFANIEAGTQTLKTIKHVLNDLFKQLDKQDGEPVGDAKAYPNVEHDAQFNTLQKAVNELYHCYYFEIKPNSPQLLNEEKDDAPELKAIKSIINELCDNLHSDSKPDIRFSLPFSETDQGLKELKAIKESINNLTKCFYNEKIPPAAEIVNLSEEDDELVKDLKKQVNKICFSLFSGEKITSKSSIAVAETDSEEVIEIKQALNLLTSNIVNHNRGPLVAGDKDSEQIKSLKKALNSLFCSINKGKKEPFSDFEEEPAQITQIKKAINALYHAEVTFNDLETIELRDGGHRVKDVQTLYSKTIEHAYQACYLLTHIDIDLQDILQKEFSQLKPFIDAIKLYAEQNTDQANDFVVKLKEYPFSYNLGFVAGVGIDQLKPQSSSEVDYGFITQLSAQIPAYLDKFTAKIREFSSKVTEKEPNLNAEQIKALQEDAISLLHSIEGLQGDGFVVSLKLLNYLHILRHTITLSTSILEQMGHLSDSSQDIIREKLGQLKYQALPNLFAAVDKVEDYSLLAPGTLSEPLMDKVKVLYAWLIEYAQKPVDFSQKGEELLEIEDSRFIRLRLEETYKRIDEANTAYFKIDKAEEARKIFFRILNKKIYAESTLIKLSPVTKKALLRQYKLIQPYVSQVDEDVNKLIVDCLTTEPGKISWLTDKFGMHNWWHNKQKTSEIAKLNRKVKSALEKAKKTYQFHIQLNTDIISSVHKRADVKLFPYTQKSNLYHINEAKLLDLVEGELECDEVDGNTLIKEKDKLSSEQALTLQQYYSSRALRIFKAQEAYHGFIQILKESPNTPLHAFKDDKKNELRNFYNVFQRYFNQALENKKGISYYDRIISHDLSGNEEPGLNSETTAITVSYFEQVDTQLRETFQTHFEKWIEKSQEYQQLADKKYNLEIAKSKFSVLQGVGKRKNHLLKHTDYSNKISRFRESVYKFKSVFNKAVSTELTVTNKGLPFPEIYDEVLVHKEAKQLIGFKRAYNSLYHLEQIVKELEKLNEKSSHSRYVYHLLIIYGELDKVYTNAKALYEDPHFSVLFDDIIKQAKEIYRVFDEQNKPYIVANDEENLLPDVKYGGMLAALNAFKIIPKHIKAIRAKENLSQAEIQELQQQTINTTLRIESIIDSSSSYFQLLMKTPAMYRLYKEFRHQLSEFSSVNHSVVKDNIEEINSELFTKMLLEADKWEDSLGLKPGTVTNTMKSVLDEFYKGLITPLVIESKEYLRLAHTMTPTNKRMLAVDEAIKKERAKYNAEVAPRLDALKKLSAKLKRFQSYASIGASRPEIKFSIQEEVVEEYKKACQFLQSDVFDKDYLTPKIKTMTVETNPDFEDKVSELIPMLEKLTINVNPKTDLAIQDILKKLKSYQDFLIKERALKNRWYGAVPIRSDLPAIMQAVIERDFSEIVALVDDESILKPDFFHPLVEVELQEGESEFKEKLELVTKKLGEVIPRLEGEKKTFEIKEQTFAERIKFLNEVKAQQKTKNAKDLEKYCKNIIDKYVSSITARYVGVSTLKKEYNEKLNAFLKENEQQTISENKFQEDVRQAIKSSIKKQVEQFDSENLYDYYYLQLIINQINEFKLYVQKEDILARKDESLFESTHTITCKINMLESLEEIASDKTKPANDRIELIKEQTEGGVFKHTMMSYKKYDSISFNWLLRRVLAFLELLHLYKPENKKLYNALNEAVLNKPKQSELTKRFGMFKETEREYQLPDKVVPDNPITPEPVM